MSTLRAPILTAAHVNLCRYTYTPQKGPWTPSKKAEGRMLAGRTSTLNPFFGLSNKLITPPAAPVYLKHVRYIWSESGGFRVWGLGITRLQRLQNPKLLGSPHINTRKLRGSPSEVAPKH